MTVGAVGGGAAITGNGTNAVTLTGTIGEINASLGGSVVYTAADNVTTSSLTTLTIATNDHGNTGTGGPLTDTDIVSVGVTPQVWFINGVQTGLVATEPRGSQLNPFSDITEFNAASLTSTGPGNNDTIYIKAGTYTGPGINLKDGQTLLGDDQALSLADPFGGPAIVIETSSGARPTISVTAGGDQAIDLGVGNTIHGINITTAAGTSGLDDGNNAVGTLTVDQMQISGAGQAVDIDQGGALSVSLESLSSSGGAEGIQLAGTASSGAGLMSGTFSVGGTGAISGSTTAGILVGDGGTTASAGGTVAVTYNGTVTTTGAAHAVDIQDRAASAGNIGLGGTISHASGNGSSIFLDQNASGTIAFSGASSVLNSGTADAVHITNNGATVNFTGGGLNIDATTGAGFLASGGGTVSVTGTGNSIATVGGTALNITNTTIGASELHFHDISANGGTNGIILNTTGSTGGLNVTGSGATSRDGTGGTITGTSGDGVLLTSASQVSLTHMNINSTGGQGVSGSAVNGFVSDWNSFSANGNATKEGAIRFGFETDPSATGLTGGAVGSATETRIDNTLISGSFERGVSIFNNSGTLTQLNLHGTTIQNSTNGSGMLLELRDTAVATADLQNSTFTGNKAAGFQGTGTDTANLTVNAIGAGGHSNTFSNNNDGVLIGSSGSADVTTEFSNNTFSGNTPGVAITVSTFQSSTASGSLSAKILNNTVSVPATGLNDAIQALMSGTGTPQHIKIDGNVITDAGTGANGIFVGTPDSGTTPNFTAIITNNTVTMTDTVNSGNGISAQSTKGGSAVFKIEGNTVSGAAIDGIFLFRPNTSTSTVSLERGGSASNTASVVLAANNPNAHSAAGGLDTEVLGTITVVNNGTITLPLNAAPGGVAACHPGAGGQHRQLSPHPARARHDRGGRDQPMGGGGRVRSQLAAMHATTFSVDDLAGKTIGEQIAGTHCDRRRCRRPRLVRRSDPE